MSSISENTPESEPPSQEDKTIERETPPKEEKPPESEPPLEDKTPDHLDVQVEGEKIQAGEEENDDEEEAECGFCLFMKGGGCKEAFISWEKCVEEAEKNKEDIVDKCFQVTGLLKKCMDAHSDYYEPVLRAEKAMEEEAAAQGLDLEGASQNKTEINS